MNKYFVRANVKLPVRIYTELTAAQQTILYSFKNGENTPLSKYITDQFLLDDLSTHALIGEKLQ